MGRQSGSTTLSENHIRLNISSAVCVVSMGRKFQVFINR